MRSARRAGKCIYIMSCLLLLLPSVYVCVLSLVSWCQLVFDAIRLAGEWVYLYILSCLLLLHPSVFVCVYVLSLLSWYLLVFDATMLAGEWVYLESIYIGLPSPSSSWPSWPAACLVPCATECHWSVRGKYCSEFWCKFILNFSSIFNYKPLRCCIYRGHTSGQS